MQSEEFEKQRKTEYNKDTGETYLSLNFASTSLHQFVREISNNEDWKALNEVCNDKTLWEYDTKKAEVPKDLSEQQDSLFDICRIQDDENKFSNALSYFIEKYPKIWINFFKEKYNDIQSKRKERRKNYTYSIIHSKPYRT